MPGFQHGVCSFNYCCVCETSQSPSNEVSAGLETSTGRNIIFSCDLIQRIDKRKKNKEKHCFEVLPSSVAFIFFFVLSLFLGELKVLAGNQPCPIRKKIMHIFFMRSKMTHFWSEISYRIKYKYFRSDFCHRNTCGSGDFRQDQPIGFQDRKKCLCCMITYVDFTSLCR